jgi:phosphoglycolate phosphatase-like HAD superfamily hydrolase
VHFCLFDIDGTLISSGGAGKAALEAALASEFGIPAISDQLRLSGRTDRAILADLARFHELAICPTISKRLTDAYLHHLPGSLAAGRGAILPGILSLLDNLRQRNNVALGLLTGNTHAGARIKLQHFGLWDYFDFGAYGDEHEDRDDVARAAWHEVRQRHAGSRPERAWVIGDTPLDIRCARAIGASAVAVATGWHSLDELASHSPDLLFSDLSDPVPLLTLLDESP